MSSETTQSVDEAANSWASAQGWEPSPIEAFKAGVAWSAKSAEQAADLYFSLAGVWDSPQERLRHAFMAGWGAANVNERASRETRTEANSVLRPDSSLTTRPDWKQPETFDAGLEAAAVLVKNWHVKKGGYTELTHRIRMMKADPNEEYSCGHCGKQLRGKYLFCDQACSDASGFTTRQDNSVDEDTQRRRDVEASIAIEKVEAQRDHHDRMAQEYFRKWQAAETQITQLQMRVSDLTADRASPAQQEPSPINQFTGGTRVLMVPLCAKHAEAASPGLVYKNDPMNCAICIQPAAKSQEDNK